MSALATAKDMADQLDDSTAAMVITVGPLLPVAVRQVEFIEAVPGSARYCAASCA